MQYISTRGATAPVNFQQALMAGLASDGGLYVPTSYPQLNLEWLRGKDYVTTALAVLRELMSDIPPADLERMLNETYVSSGLFPGDVVPVQQLEQDLWLMKLSEGPTHAFKDIPLQLVGALMSYVLSKNSGELNILGATSGDTGSAAAHAVRGRKNLRLFMLSPKDRMSPFQRAQMYTLDEPNIFNLVVDGTFDDCQAVVKAVNADAPFKEYHNIGAMNSINWARIASQVVYGVSSHAKIAVHARQPVSFAIPSGNFGNALATYVAGQMGVPLHSIIVGTNENDVLDELFRTGVYRPRTGNEVRETSSPSMDIAAASNLERYLFDLLRGDGKALAHLMTELKDKGSIDFLAPRSVQPKKGELIKSGMATEEEVIDTIRETYQKYGVIIDPHTAVAMKVGLEQVERGVPLIIAETAQPAKFAATIQKALGFDPARPKGSEGLENRREHVKHIAADPEAVKDFIQANLP